MLAHSRSILKPALKTASTKTYLSAAKSAVLFRHCSFFIATAFASAAACASVRFSFPSSGVSWRFFGYRCQSIHRIISLSSSPPLPLSPSPSPPLLLFIYLVLLNIYFISCVVSQIFGPDDRIHFSATRETENKFSFSATHGGLYKCAGSDASCIALLNHY
jgi:hypothetical protein